MASTEKMAAKHRDSTDDDITAKLAREDAEQKEILKGRAQALADWLHKVEAVCLHEQKFGKNGSVIATFAVRGRVCVVLKYLHGGVLGGAWDVFTGPRSSRIDATLDDAEMRLDWREPV